MKTEDKTNSMLKESRRDEYISRINRVIDYINENIDKELTLEKLAGVASFSQFHFHRLFKAMVGETLNQYIKRIRVEKAAAQLIANPKKSITEIAFDCGFSGSATFARVFKEFFRMSAGEWRALEGFQNSKNCKTNGKDDQTISKIRKDFDVSSVYFDDVTQNFLWRITMKDKKQAQIEVKDMPDLNVAYLRHIGPYKGDSKLFEELFTKLMTWAGPRGLIRFPETQMLSVYHDDPNITDEDKLRIDVCISVPDDTEVDGEVGKTTIPGGKFAVARFELADDEYEEAWNVVMGGWLPESGYQPDDRRCYELYQNDPKQHPENKCIVDICVPVKPL